ncbi:MAG: hypothetical protein D8M58_10440 [Calditrichaeota bacterium]|nr:MAG: hypothetical protein DWQ03_09815 [Calditrichota bacterium]MBL1205808.1 hypothetical protein [Calditrichota bacterium]NOG45636.1 hypothetical protein [Calditrichota bacterium]
MTPDDVAKKLKDTIISFEEKCLSYYLHFESSERKLAQDIKNKIKEKYGSEKFMPALGWKESFGELADSDILDNEIKKYLESISYNEEKFVLPKDRIKNMIWNNARVEGKKILSRLG